MKTAIVEYIAGSDLSDLAITWLDSQQQLYDLTGYTFDVKVASLGLTTALFTKSTNITGTNANPNLIISWVDGELDSLTPGSYRLQITATRISDSKERRAQIDLLIKAAIV